MVKLTAELIEQAAQFTNPVRDRELDLRGYKIPVIENLGATLDQFDTIDLSDNEIRKIDGFPLLRRLKSLIINNNRVCRFSESLDQSLPSLNELILTNNNLQELTELDPLSSLKSLRFLSLLRNPVTTKKNYRLYTVYKLPQVRVLDFQKVKLKERQEAERLFKGKKSVLLSTKEGVNTAKTFTPGAGLVLEKKKAGPTPAEMEAIKAAIINASSLEEVTRLKSLLQAGHIPGQEKPAAAAAASATASATTPAASASAQDDMDTAAPAESGNGGGGDAEEEGEDAKKEEGGDAKKEEDAKKEGDSKKEGGDAEKDAGKDAGTRKEGDGGARNNGEAATETEKQNGSTEKVQDVEMSEG
ncbi:U2 small nuclear ribonucleoprotein A' isoform X1 [Lethenteron reissneri]|uniref:U2 small nuclear ribonucleoprotein A' isoform X1 n=1 Tax=Lethenteron reissneri TaxID=7753 RepID=UPI002AB6AD34|nr:U2 small nuclear ribonucleoprotein A' isoform X1 [Lethenteron reissneri]